MKKIFLYLLNGELDHEEELTKENIRGINGMMTRCHMINGEELVGFSNVFRSKDGTNFNSEIQGYIHLWTWDNLDEETHQLVGDGVSKFDQTFIPVNIDSIKYIEAILRSNPRFGSRLTNKFSQKVKKKE